MPANAVGLRWASTAVSGGPSSRACSRSAAAMPRALRASAPYVTVPPPTSSAAPAADAVLALDFVAADGVARALVEELFAPEDVEVARPTALLDDVLKRRQLSRRAHLVAVGSPPQDGIGYGLVPFVALALRA